MSPERPVLQFATPIARRFCPRCKSQLMLAPIMLRRSGIKVHTFDCPKCNYELVEEVLERDPLKRASGWLSGELRPPL
jgi:transposase-like protein